MRTRCDPARVARLVLSLLTGAMARQTDGGRLAVRATAEGEHAVLRLVPGRERVASVGRERSVPVACSAHIG